MGGLPLVDPGDVGTSSLAREAPASLLAYPNVPER
jgi:hypothetical protein